MPNRSKSDIAISILAPGDVRPSAILKLFVISNYHVKREKTDNSH